MPAKQHYPVQAQLRQAAATPSGLRSGGVRAQPSHVGPRICRSKGPFMRLVATYIPTAQAAAFDFTEPGGTIGRCPGNHLLLSEDTRVGRIQAVVRIKDGAWSLNNVSSRADIMINGQALPLLQDIPIARGDRAEASRGGEECVSTW